MDKSDSDMTDAFAADHMYERVEEGCDCECRFNNEFCKDTPVSVFNQI